MIAISAGSFQIDQIELNVKEAALRLGVPGEQA